MVERTVSAALALGLLDFAVSRGADRAALLSRSGICEAALEDRDNRIAYPRYVALMRAGKALSGDEALALHFGEAVDLGEISVVGLIGMASRSMAEAMAQLNRYGCLVIDVDTGDAVRFSNELDARGIWMTDHRQDPNAFPELTEVTFARMICGVRRFAPQLTVHQVEVTHPRPPYAAEMERILRAPVCFGAGRNAYRIDEEWLTIRLDLQPAYSFGILSKHAEQLLLALDSPATLRERVEQRIMAILHTGEASIERVSSDMGMSRQTLYRGLKASDETFESVLEVLRRRLARDYLSGGRLSVNQTAYLLGYSDPAAFSRAFKRWEGFSPRDAKDHLTLT